MIYSNKKYLLLVGCIALLFVGCKESSILDSGDSLEVIKLDQKHFPSKLCADPGDTNCEEPPENPNPPTPPEEGIEFDVSSTLYPTCTQAIGVASVSTEEPVDYISIELKLYKPTFGYSYNDVEGINTDNVQTSVAAPLYSGSWTLTGSVKIIDGNIEETREIYITDNFTSC